MSIENFVWSYRDFSIGGKSVLGMPPLEVLDHYFELDSNGILWRIRTANNKLLNQKKLAGKLNSGSQYMTETIRDSDGKKGTILVHRLVFWMKFRRDIEANKVINHIDRNKLNNHPSNLEEVSLSENTIHA